MSLQLWRHEQLHHFQGGVGCQATGERSCGDNEPWHSLKGGKKEKTHKYDKSVTLHTLSKTFYSASISGNVILNVALFL